MKLNNSDQLEIMWVVLSKEKTPIAFEQIVLSLIDSGVERDEAEQMASEPIDVEAELMEFEDEHGGMRNCGELMVEFDEG